MTDTNAATSTAEGRTRTALVVTVDDNAAVRDAVHKLMLSAGMECVCFASTRELLEANVLDRPGRLIDRAAVSRANSKFRQALRQL